METENNQTTEITAQEPVADRSDSVQTGSEPATDVVSVEDLLPALRGVASENNAELAETVTQSVVENMPEISEHPLMSTDFNDYTVTEGLLLLIALVLVINFFLTLIRRWF